MKGFLEVVRADHKNHEFVNISHIVSIVGNRVITDGIDTESMYNDGCSVCPCSYVIATAHTHKELVELLNKAIEEVQND